MHVSALNGKAAFAAFEASALNSPFLGLRNKGSRPNNVHAVSQEAKNLIFLTLVNSVSFSFVDDPGDFTAQMMCDDRHPWIKLPESNLNPPFRCLCQSRFLRVQ